VRLYVEGGGKDTKARLRTAFGRFLAVVVQRARGNRVRWQIVACRGRNATFDAFRMAQRTHPQAFVVLLVDAEGPCSTSGPWQHLAAPRYDGWMKPKTAEDDQCHLMVQVMESWFLVDPNELGKYYGQGFRAAALPDRTDVERIDKNQVLKMLSNATGHTKKGPYHKTRPAPGILKAIRSDLVRSRAHHCDRLFRVLLAAVSES
jgi:hypothetical protein